MAMRCTSIHQGCVWGGGGGEGGKEGFGGFEVWRVEGLKGWWEDKQAEAGRSESDRIFHDCSGRMYRSIKHVHSTGKEKKSVGSWVNQEGTGGTSAARLRASPQQDDEDGRLKLV